MLDGPPRSSAESVYFNGKIWILGGHSTGGQNLNDVWSSSDGINWTQVTANAPWSARLEHTSIVFNNKIWVIGGMDDNSGLLNDVWSSSDGIKLDTSYCKCTMVSTLVSYFCVSSIIKCG
jgi:N-acetylneuraminic acid mutarotase